MSDERWMQRALDLAARGRGQVEPNPMVGAIVVRDGVCVGEGWHQCYGGPHAEVFALHAAREKAQGSTLYVSLEPCCHHGKTPPCTDLILQSQVSRVVAAMRDPFPLVAGGGLSILHNSGLIVDVGLCEEQARLLNAPYLKLLERKRPYVHAKWAMTLDGKIATKTGDSRWISNESSRQIVHALRGRMDAILIGIGTALTDDPLLTARPSGPRLATRVILDRQGRLPVQSQLVQTARQFPTLVFAAESVSASAALALRQQGCEVVLLPDNNRVPFLTAVLDELGRRRFTNLLVEGGGEVLGSFLDIREIDEVHVFLAPKLIGGENARSPVLGVGIDLISNALTLASWDVQLLAGDFYLHGFTPLGIAQVSSQNPVDGNSSISAAGQSTSSWRE